MCIKEDALNLPLLYVSEYFNNDRETYTNALFDVSAKGDLNKWISYFLTAVATQARQSIELLEALEAHKKFLREKGRLLTNTTKIETLIEMLFENPFITIVDLQARLGDKHAVNASRLVNTLENEGMLKEITGKKSHKIFVDHKIMNIIDRATNI